MVHRWWITEKISVRRGNMIHPMSGLKWLIKAYIKLKYYTIEREKSFKIVKNCWAREKLIKTDYTNLKPPNASLTCDAYLCNGTFGKRERVLPWSSPRWGDTDRERWCVVLCCSGTVSVVDLLSLVLDL